MMETKALADNPPSLDHNGEVAILLNKESQPQGGTRHYVALDIRKMGLPDMLGKKNSAFMQGLSLQANDAEYSPTPHYDPVKQQIVFETPIPPTTTHLTIGLQGRPVAYLNYDGSSLKVDPAKPDVRAVVSDLRMIATSERPVTGVPVPLEMLKGFDPAKHAPITDLHTHSSAQINAADLMRMALDHKLSYPVELLARLGIQLNEDEKRAISPDGVGYRFSPLEREGLACEVENKRCDVVPLAALTPQHRDRLQHQFQIPQDMTMCFSDFDREVYRFVNPLVKNPVLAKDMILRIAEDYKRHGVKYAELSTASMLNLDKDGKASWFKAMVEAVDEAQEKHGVTLRFLVGVPRVYGPAKVMAELEKIKYAARHPYIAGVDLLGYESNRTSDFSAALAHIADWARAYDGSSDLDPKAGWDFKRDFTVRVHAGETGKNVGNVAEAVNIAERYGVKVRIAHALNASDDRRLDQKITKLSRMHPPLVSMEFCPDSNLGYNNIQHVQQVPFERWLSCCKSWFLGTDGGGAIKTTPVQVAKSALTAGVTLGQLEEMRANEEAFIAQARKDNTLKAKAFHSLYPDNQAFLDGIGAHIKQVQELTNPATLDPINPKLPAAFEGKTAILIAGSGDDAPDDKHGSRQDVRRAMHMLVNSVDPQKVYFVTARTKNAGVTAALDEALMEHNEMHPTNKFQVLGLSTEDTTDLAHSISWLVPQRGGRDQVPDNLISFMRAREGVAVFIGGKNFTGDMIQKCRQGSPPVPYLLMENSHGASQNFAKKTLSERLFSNGRTLISRLADLLPQQEMFREGINPHDSEQLAQLEQDAHVGFARQFIQRVVGDAPKHPTAGRENA